MCHPVQLHTRKVCYSTARKSPCHAMCVAFYEILMKPHLAYTIIIQTNIFFMFGICTLLQYDWTVLVVSLANPPGFARKIWSRLFPLAVPFVSF
jgi:hypothetical protein